MQIFPAYLSVYNDISFRLIDECVDNSIEKEKMDEPYSFQMTTKLKDNKTNTRKLSIIWINLLLAA